MGRAIVRQPQAFLMDEPLSNLDAKLRVQMRADISKLQRDLETTTIYVAHDQVEAMTMGDRVAVMNFGVLQQVDTPQRLFDNPANLFVAGFIGTPPMNLIEATVSVDGDDVTLSIGAQAILAPEALRRYPGLRGANGCRVVMGVHPADFHLATDRPVADGDGAPRADRGARHGVDRVLPHRRAGDQRRGDRGGRGADGRRGRDRDPSGLVVAVPAQSAFGLRVDTDVVLAVERRRSTRSMRSRASRFAGAGAIAVAIALEVAARGDAAARAPSGATLTLLAAPPSTARSPRSGSTSSCPTATRTATRRTTSAGSPARAASPATTRPRPATTTAAT